MNKKMKTIGSGYKNSESALQVQCMLLDATLFIKNQETKTHSSNWTREAGDEYFQPDKHSSQYL